MEIIKIGNKEFNARSSALTSKIYRQMFGKDLMIEMTQSRKSKDTKVIEMFKELAFVLVWQAKERTMPISQAIKALSEDDFIEWVDQFDEMDFFNQETLTQITNIWLKNSESLVNAKNLQSLQ